ncbi:MAG TPA: dienelactone hydrolase family protein [Planctomycetota bacterium]|jgi:hypothetical protein
MSYNLRPSAVAETFGSDTLKRIMTIAYAAGLLLLLTGMSLAQENGVVDLQRPPVPLPRDMPKLSPLVADDAAAWATQREKLRAAWEKVLGPLPKTKAPLNAQVLATEDLPEFTRQHVTYQIEEGVMTDGYLLTPKTPAPKAGFPAMVVFHPTVKSHAKEPAGIECERAERLHGPQLVKRGYVVLCPRCFIFADGADYKTHVANLQARHSDWTGMLRMLYDGIRAADYLETLSNVDKSRFGCFGHSLGAKETLYSAAFDERFKVAVFSEGGIGLPFSNWDAVWYLGKQIKEVGRASLPADGHGGPPHLALDHHQLISLIAPRGFLLLAGESADNDKSWAYIEAALPVYKLLGVPQNIGWFNHRKDHTYPPEAQTVTESFIERMLK